MFNRKVVALGEIYNDFILSKKSILVSDGMIRFYDFTAKRFVGWLEKEGVNNPKNIHAKHVRQFLSELANRGLSDSYLHGNARAIKTFCKFLYHEGFIKEEIKFQMPPIRKKLLPVLNAEKLNVVLSACESIRDRAIIMFMVDTGLRRAEVCSLNWEDVNLNTGVVILKKGKWSKPRSVMIGLQTRKIISEYKRKIKAPDNSPLFQNSNGKSGKRLSPTGLRSLMVRLTNKTGIHFTCHALRRTCATLSVKAGMNLIHLQSILGHASLEMTLHYVTMLEEDLIEAHKSYGAVDKFIT